ncbi:MAG: AraC family transcriptional regulator [Erysipelotrichaceae bacterium]
MSKIIEIQNPYCSNIDQKQFCGFDIEVVEEETKPLIHQTARFLFFKKGKGTIVIDDIEYDIIPNTFVAILPWEITKISSVKEQLQNYKIIYNSEVTNNIIKSIYNTDNEMLEIIDAFSKSPVVYCNKEEARQIEYLLRDIRYEVGMDSMLEEKESEELGNIYTINKIIELIVIFKRLLNKQIMVQNGKTLPKQDHKNKMLKYIYSHASEKLTLSRMSDLFYMSESAISKYIQDTTGLTFNDLLNEVRIEKAINFLMYTDLTLNEIAAVTGYVDASHISKVFASRIGTTPNEYRKIYRKLNNIMKEKEKQLSYQVISYIHEYFDREDMNCAMVANQFNISIVELNRLLITQVEKNFDDLLHVLRINKACELLLSSEDAIADIAIEIGYNNAKTFSRNFLKIKNMTPGVFRKSILLQEE